MGQLDALNQVAEFHRTFRHPVQALPMIPSEDRSRLRVALLAEELKELEVAILQNDIVEVADALCDLQYVLAGAVLEFGLGDKFVELFNEVQRSNMSKACDTLEEAEATMDHYKEKGVNCHFKEDAGKYLVYRTSDNKTLKNINYSPADLVTIINQDSNLQPKS